LKVHGPNQPRGNNRQIRHLRRDRVLTGCSAGFSLQRQLQRIGRYCDRRKGACGLFRMNPLGKVCPISMREGFDQNRYSEESPWLSKNRV
jgi:hypothetical protein